jgi:hypothetical protein
MMFGTNLLLRDAFLGCAHGLLQGTTLTNSKF